MAFDAYVVIKFCYMRIGHVAAGYCYGIGSTVKVSIAFKVCRLVSSSSFVAYKILAHTGLYNPPYAK